MVQKRLLWVVDYCRQRASTRVNDCQQSVIIIVYKIVFSFSVYDIVHALSSHLFRLLSWFFCQRHRHATVFIRCCRFRVNATSTTCTQHCFVLLSSDYCQ
jgi:hypothetical protein